MMTNNTIIGDCRLVLPTLPEAIAHTCVTSPPYFGLRNYGHPDQIGLEQTPEAYIETMVAVFREVRRVLRPDGTLWLNIGDTYSGGKIGRADMDKAGRERLSAHGHTGYKNKTITAERRKDAMPEKQLLGIPW